MHKIVILLALSFLSLTAAAASLSLDCKYDGAVINIATLNENGLHFETESEIFKDFHGPLVDIAVTDTKVELHGRTKGIEAWVDLVVLADLEAKSITVTQIELGLVRSTFLCDEILVNRSF